MELVRAYWYRHPGEFQAAINVQMARQGGLTGWWVTQDGIKLKAHMMNDNHLLRAIAMIEKNEPKAVRKLAMHVVRERLTGLETMERRAVVRLREKVTYINLVREAYKRGLIQDE